MKRNDQMFALRCPKELIDLIDSIGRVDNFNRSQIVRAAILYYADFMCRHQTCEKNDKKNITKRLDKCLSSNKFFE